MRRRIIEFFDTRRRWLRFLNLKSVTFDLLNFKALSVHLTTRELIVRETLPALMSITVSVMSLRMGTVHEAAVDLFPEDRAANGRDSEDGSCTG